MKKILALLTMCISLASASNPVDTTNEFHGRESKRFTDQLGNDTGISYLTPLYPWNNTLPITFKFLDGANKKTILTIKDIQDNDTIYDVGMRIDDALLNHRLSITQSQACLLLIPDCSLMPGENNYLGWLFSKEIFEDEKDTLWKDWMLNFPADPQWNKDPQYIPPVNLLNHNIVTPLNTPLELKKAEDMISEWKKQKHKEQK